NRTASIELVFSLRVPVDEGDVLHGEAWMVLVLAVRRGPALRLVARVHVQDARGPSTAQRHQASTAADDVGTRVVEHLGGAVERDRERVGTAIERDDASTRDGVDERVCRATLRGAVADDVGRIGHVFEARLRGDGTSPVRIAGSGTVRWIGEGIVDVSPVVRGVTVAPLHTRVGVTSEDTEYDAPPDDATDPLQPHAALIESRSSAREHKESDHFGSAGVRPGSLRR